MSVKATYRRGTRSAREVQTIVDDLLSSLGADDLLTQEIRQHGVEPADLSPGSIEVREDGAGLDPAVVELIVTFLAPPFLEVWKHVLLPRIRRRWGINTLGEEVNDNQAH